MSELRQQDLQAAFGALNAICEGALDIETLGQRGVRALPGVVASELTTLSVCDLVTGQRRVIGPPGEAISRHDLEAFDHFFFQHPLVRFHAGHHEGGCHRISDSIGTAAFRRTPLYNEYYRRIGIDCAVAMPLFVDHRTLVSFVLNRSGRDFSEADRSLLELVRPLLATLYRFAAAREPQGSVAAALLTAREREVLDWVAAGKTNADIAAILDLSPRTIEKHLEHVYEKLGVETRTAAAMRAMRSGYAA